MIERCGNKKKKAGGGGENKIKRKIIFAFKKIKRMCLYRQVNPLYQFFLRSDTNSFLHSNCLNIKKVEKEVRKKDNNKIK